MNPVVPATITPASCEALSRRPISPNGRAFTLVELLTVIAIIGILAAILIPVVSRVRESARAATCMSNLRQIGTAVQMFVADNKGLLPGSGKRIPTASASWHDVLNALVFEVNINGNRQPLQRMGDTPIQGEMYCPDMEPFGTALRYPRAYVMNGNIINQDPIANPPVTWGILLEYQKGLPINQFANPPRTVLVLESERSGDGVGPSAPFDQIVMGDGVSAPSWSANSTNFAFRHNNHMNVLFMDCHVQSVSPDEAAKINNKAHFTASGL